LEHTILEWSAFLALVLTMLALDLGVFNRKDHVVGPARPWAGPSSG